MQEKILLMPGADGTELVRSLAARGVCLAGLRVVDGLELARIGLTQSGVALGGRLISGKKQEAMVSEIMDGIEYFQPAAYSDAQHLAAALNDLRHAASGDLLREKLPKGEFAEKNAALLQALDAYEEKLRAQGLTDGAAVIRQAAEQASPLDEDKFELACAEGYPLTPLERELLDKLSGGRAKTLTLAQLYNTAEGSPQAVSVTEAYGASNEVEDIINTIFAEKLPLDKCVVAVTDGAKYSRLFAELCGRLGIPLTLGCGTLLTSTYPAKLLSLCRAWAVSGSFGIDGLSDLVFSESFDRKKLWKKCFGEEEYSSKLIRAAVGTAGSLRLGWDKTLNVWRIDAYRKTLDPNSTDKDVIAEIQALDAAEKIFAELEQGAEHILAGYAVIRKSALGAADKSARERLCAQLRELPEGTDICAVIPRLLTGFVRPENSRGGALHVTLIEKAACTMRDNLFIAGLSAESFPGAPKEDHLILDCDCALFEKGALPDSAEKTLRRKELLRRLMGLAAGLGCSVRLSCCEYNTAEMKDENRSSALFELMEELAGAEQRKAGFFTSPLLPESEVGRAYIGGSLPVGTAAPSAEEQPVTDLRGFADFSPSAIEIFFGCPKHFLLERILGIRPAEEDDPFEVINARDSGKLLHKVMELAAKSPDITEEELLALGEAQFDGFLKKRPPVHPDEAERIRREFLRMLKNAYHQGKDNKVIAAELELKVPHTESGITLTGLLDRAEVTPDGTCIIADFKTGRTVHHKDNDLDSCLQTLIYAYMMNAKGFKVTQCEYRYVRLDKTVTCRYDEDMKKKLDEKLCGFAEALNNNSFECTPSDDSCKFCKLGNICGKERA